MLHITDAVMPTVEKRARYRQAYSGLRLIMAGANALENLVKQSSSAQNRRPGLYGILYLCFLTARRVPTEAANHTQKKVAPRISRIVQSIPQIRGMHLS
jgi:hypothetical protein